MSIYQRPGSDIWYCYIERGTKVIRKSSKTSDKEKAQEWHDKLAADLWRQTALGEKPPVARRTWGELAPLWAKKKSRFGKQRSESDLYRLVWITKRWQSNFIDEIDRHLFYDLVGELDDVSDATLARYRSQVVAILNVGADLEWIKAAPKIPSYGTFAGRLRWLSAEEWDKLQKELPEHLLLMGRFTLACGLRRHNVTHLEWSQVNMASRVVWIHPEQAKGGVAMGIPLNDDAMQILQDAIALREKNLQKQIKKLGEGYKGKMPELSKWVFPFRGEPIVKTSGKAWKEALERAGIEHSFTWHGLRHTWASWHRLNGTSLEDLMDLGGWKSIKMVQIYAHINPSYLLKAASNVKPVSTSQNTNPAQSDIQAMQVAE